MDSIQSCVNRGGPQSVVRLSEVPQLERECLLVDEGLVALHCWQARPGEILTVVDPENAAYRARISSIDDQEASCVPFEKFAAPAESPLHIEVFQSLPDKERFELVLQKLTEIGATRIVPVESFRSATVEERDSGQKKSHRWPDVVSRAARQCRRAMLPELMSPCSFDEALALADGTELKLMLYEGDAPWSLREAIGSLRPQNVALFVGPEGGFSDAEVEQARDSGFLPINLGQRILRTETASIVATTLLQAYLGDLG